MDFLFVVAVAFQIAGIASKRYDSSSDESSIENILYYKDCSHKAKPTPPQPMRLEDPPKPQPECVPKMCCSMSCANNCGQDANPNQYMERQRMPMMQPFQSPPRQPVPLNQKQKQNKQMTKPIGGRRSMGIEFTREHIKSLISQDEDIKKILKDLVRVTMQKVDLIEMINARRNAHKMDQVAPGAFSTNHSEEEDDEVDM